MRLVIVAATALVLAACSGAPPVAPTCAKGTTACGNECADLTSSATHCGACGTACAASESCVASACFANTCSSASCSLSQICNDGRCQERTCVGISCAAGQGCLGGVCVPAACGATECPTGQLCVSGTCADTACFGVLCPTGQTCQLGACTASHCTNGTLDADETDVDCGGSCATKCKATQVCSIASDCTSNSCIGGHCAQAASCSDGVRNHAETDVDCGGAECGLRCTVGQGCLVGSDCTSMACVSGVCAGPSCSDGKKNGTETDIDCGGSCTLRCAEGQHCGVPGDCTSMGCTAGVCSAPSCTDGVKNGTETDVDCGGGCALRCAIAQHCALPADCTSMSCASGACAGPTCSDLVKNGSETDVDCGGSCARCANGKSCSVSGDCVSTSCLSGLCTGSSCTDGVQNGNETDVDCGGATCPTTCVDGKLCLLPRDCVSQVCSGGRCVAPSCTDQVKNGNEADVDCGGPCSTKCAAGKTCGTANDCADHVCTTGVCVGPTCFDGAKNATETDVDCGGACARKCSSGQACMVATDCASNICSGMTCGADPLANGLAGYWTLNTADINGNAIIDASGNGNTATFIGSFASTAGRIGEAAQLAGGSYLAAGASINPTTAFTLSTWFKSGPTGSLQNLVSRWCTQGLCGDANQSFRMAVESSGAASCLINGLNSNDYLVSTGAAVVTDNNWHLITCTVDKNQPGPNLVIYVDGSVAGQSVVAAQAFATAPEPVHVGEGVYGTLDDVRIYTRALSATEVSMLRGMSYPGVPVAPTSLGASAVSSFQIDLSWVKSTSPGVTGYVVERSLTGTSNWFPVAVVGGTASTFSDTTLPAGMKFYYRVSAQTPTGSSAPATGASATTTAGVITYSVPTGLSGYWTCNAADVSGTIESDASGNNNNASLVGGPTPVAGRIGEAMQSSVSTALAIGNAASISPNQAFTLSAWVKTTQTGTAQLINKFCPLGPCGDANQGFRLSMNNSPGSGVASCLFNGVSYNDYQLNGLAPINDGVWHLVTCTADSAGNGNNFKLYVDGVLDTNRYVGTDVLATTTDPIRVATQLIGLIDDVRIYGRALTATEIHTLYNNGSMGSP